MLMVGNRVLHNNTKMLKMGVFFMFVYDYGHQEALLDSKASSLDQDVPQSLISESQWELPSDSSQNVRLMALGAPFSAFRGPPRSRSTSPAATNRTGRSSCVLARPLAPSFPMKTWLGPFFCRRAARSPSRSAPPRSPKSGRSRAVRVGDARRRAPARVLMRPVRVRLCGDVAAVLGPQLGRESGFFGEQI